MAAWLKSDDSFAAAARLEKGGCVEAPQSPWMAWPNVTTVSQSQPERKGWQCGSPTDSMGGVARSDDSSAVAARMERVVVWKPHGVHGGGVTRSDNSFAL